MSNLQKKLDQLEKIQAQIQEEKIKTQTFIGKQLIETLDLDYSDLTKENIHKIMSKIKTIYPNSMVQHQEEYNANTDKTEHHNQQNNY